MCNRTSRRFLCGHTTRDDDFCRYAIVTFGGESKRFCSAGYGYKKIRVFRICEVCDLVCRLEDGLEEASTGE